MSTAQTRPAFDQQERDAIQRSLRRYMEEHRIGTPTLQLRIMEADEPHRRELPLSTLQRFITGAHRTSDAYVDMCRRFLESVGARVAAPEFGAALAGFLGGSPAGGEAAGVATYDGAYIIHADDEALPEIQRRAFATFTPVPGADFLAVSETVHETWREDAPSRRQIFEGAFVIDAPRACMVLRSCLTRQPKTYLLRCIPPGTSDVAVLEGVATYADLENTIRKHAVRIDMRSDLIGEAAGSEVPE